MSPPRLKALVVDDEDELRRPVERILTQRGHEVAGFADAESAWEAYQRDGHQLVLLDWMLPGMSGLDLCRRIRALPDGPPSVIVILTGRAGPEDLQAVLDAGADDYISKPVELALLHVRLTIAERRAQELTSLSEAIRRIALLEEQSGARSAFQGLVGGSAPMQQVYQRLRLAAQSDVTVLLTGASGTGKELGARALHALSVRREKPFIAVNCSAIPDTLLESELFGHVRGAFTGAIRDKVGLFQSADGGTLFLDEIGDVSPLLQVKLLRVLQEHEVRRVGDERPTKVDVRIVGATNRDLRRLLASGDLREDFYFRIRVFEIHLPSISERRSDVPALANHFLAELSRGAKKEPRGVTQDALRLLMEYSWPGNVRELRNAIEYGLVTSQGAPIGPDDLPPELREAAIEPTDLPVPAQDAGAEPDERKRILQALDASGGNRNEAAKRLGISRVTLWKRLRRLGLQSSESQGPVKE
ncbi:MAG: sigma-54-dependent Fis family transcriptional regulator [Planctomycetes bacterium]|nr:sigma-54-dependent Fis family transcriptional regulator [Planctomycetota bacterium]